MQLLSGLHYFSNSDSVHEVFHSSAFRYFTVTLESITLALCCQSRYAPIQNCSNMQISPMLCEHSHRSMVVAST